MRDTPQTMSQPAPTEISELKSSLAEPVVRVSTSSAGGTDIAVVTKTQEKNHYHPHIVHEPSNGDFVPAALPHRNKEKSNHSIETPPPLRIKRPSASLSSSSITAPSLPNRNQERSNRCTASSTESLSTIPSSHGEGNSNIDHLVSTSLTTTESTRVSLEAPSINNSKSDANNNDNITGSNNNNDDQNSNSNEDKKKNISDSAHSNDFDSNRTFLKELAKIKSHDEEGGELSNKKASSWEDEYNESDTTANQEVKVEDNICSNDTSVKMVPMRENVSSDSTAVSLVSLREQQHYAVPGAFRVQPAARLTDSQSEASVRATQTNPVDNTPPPPQQQQQQQSDVLIEAYRVSSERLGDDADNNGNSNNDEEGANGEEATNVSGLGVLVHAEPISKFSQRPKRRWMILTGFLVVVSIAVGVSVGLVVNRNREVAELWEVLQTLLPNYTLEALADSTSPQSLALNWSMHDPNLLNYTDERNLQRYILATLFFATNNTGWRHLDRWLDYDHHECDWYSSNIPLWEEICGTATDDDVENEGTSSGLSDSEDYSEDPLWYEIIHLSRNTLNGTLPLELWLLYTLIEINVAHNGIEGSIASNINKLTNLAILDVENNLMNGTIPSDIGMITKLEWMHLGRNQISGTIPSEIGNLLYLQIFNARENRIDGTIPSELWICRYLTEINLNDNSLIGSIASDLMALSSLVILDLGSNLLTGYMPSEIGALNNLAVLKLDHNEGLSGTLPHQMGNLSSLELLIINNTSFEGTIPTVLGNLRHLNEMNMEGNFFHGEIPTELGLLTNLTSMYLESNHLTGVIPSTIGLLHHTLKIITLHNNQLTGTVPIELCEMVRSGSCILQIDCDSVDCFDCGCICGDVDISITTAPRDERYSNAFNAMNNTNRKSFSHSSNGENAGDVSTNFSSTSSP